MIGRAIRVLNDRRNASEKNAANLNTSDIEKGARILCCHVPSDSDSNNAHSITKVDSVQVVHHVRRTISPCSRVAGTKPESAVGLVDGTSRCLGILTPLGFCNIPALVLQHTIE
eukprot:4228587-Amphidinium_carterae.2